MSKIVVVVRSKILMKTEGGFTQEVDTETKTYENAHAFNNERGELIISRKPVEIEKAYASFSEGLSAVDYNARKADVIAVFKEWLYWEKLE